MLSHSYPLVLIFKWFYSRCCCSVAYFQDEFIWRRHGNCRGKFVFFTTQVKLFFCWFERLDTKKEILKKKKKDLNKTRICLIISVHNCNLWAEIIIPKLASSSALKSSWVLFEVDRIGFVVPQKSAASHLGFPARYAVLSPHWFLGGFPYALIGRCDYCDFSFTTLISNALWDNLW